MSEHTAIEWCDSTFNPWIGCTKVSTAASGGGGCDHCYAARSTPARTMQIAWGPGQPRRRTAPATWKQPLLWNREHEAFMLMHGRRRRVFCASLADVFDNEVPPPWRADLFQLIADTPNLDWLLLTKRIGNAAKMLDDAALHISRGSFGWDVDNYDRPMLPNVWLGISVVNQPEADRDIMKLRLIPASVRFLSIEPMLGPIDIRRHLWPVHESWPARYSSPAAAIEAGATVTYKRQALLGAAFAATLLSWVICGGESGPNARPIHPDWARSLRDQCGAARVPFLFKQWGEWMPRGPESLGYPPVDNVPRVRLTDAGQNGQDLGSKGGNDCWMQRAGKKAAGRLLDGREHNGFPEVR